MDSEGSSVSVDKIDETQSETKNNSENDNDNTKSCIEKEEDKGSDKSSFDEDTAEVHGETKEATTIISEKEVTASNIADENTAEAHNESNKEATTIISERDATPSNVTEEDTVKVCNESDREATTITPEKDATLSNVTEEDTAEVCNESNKEAITITSEKDATPSNVTKEDTAEVQNETNKEAIIIASEKDTTPSNVTEEDAAEVQSEINKGTTTIISEKDAIDDSATYLQTTIEKDNSIGIEVLSSEKNTEIVTIEESNVVESFCKESASANVDKETTELSAFNLTAKSNTEQSLNLEDSCNISENNCAKFSSDKVINNLETFKDKPESEDCDIPDESSVNVDDLQISQKDVDLSKKVESESSDSNLENLDKDLSEKNIEPENTEFIQFSHDKHDDSQIEGQSIDAEDPFGGDNLTSENVEPVETDSLLVDDEISFKNLYEQGDNLQDAVNARNNDSNNDKLNVDCTSNDGKDTNTKAMDNIAEESNNVPITIDSLESTAMDTDLPDTNISETENTSSTKLSDKQVEQTKKTIEEITPMETDEEQTDVLPGQDDELCIIPDSMKVIIPNKSGVKTDKEQNKSALEKDKKDETIQKSSKSNSELEQDADKSEPKSAITKNKNSKEDNTVAIQKEPIVEVQTATTDIINIDDESKSSEVEEITTKEICKQCGEERACKIRVKIGKENYHVCSKTCKALFKAANNKTVDIPHQRASSKREKRCASCLLIIEANDERNLSWETMEFCNEECLGKFQRKYGSYCKNCNGTVQAVSLGKYCVRFGCDVRQFCCSTCLEEFKKGLKVCSYCQKDISFSTDGFLAPVGEKGQFKDFCTQDCMEKYSKLNSSEPPTTEKKPCSVCQEEKLVHCEVQIYNSTPVAICSEPCFAAFNFVKQVNPEQCSTCKKFFELPNKQHFIVFYDNEPHTFCNKTCLNIFIITNRKIVPCNWCKVKKYNFDMIKKELKTGQILMMCSLNCLTLYQVSINAVSAKRINCDFCKEYSLAHYHLTMSDATIRNFCSYNCVMNFQAQYTKSPITIPSSDDPTPVPTGVPKRTTLSQKSASQTAQKPSDIQNKKTMPVISSVTSLASIGNGQASPNSQQNIMPTSAISNQSAQIVYNQQVITRPPTPVKVQNKTTQCKPLVHTKGVSVRPHPCTKWTQTKEEKVQQVLVPIPVPIYVPFPMHMYSMPFPVPMPFPLPIPVPLFIPTTRNSAKGIMKDIKKIQEKIPADPYEAELLMMAEMVATEKKANDSDSDSVDDR
ncbi:zinc finger MYM-type protein 2 isoform X2 [Nylanderia fulva]|nr:zinc finger MYM-type protein 2 isoform X2 [Nylanderia fulva]